jgi:hypothetical protein
LALEGDSWANPQIFFDGFWPAWGGRTTLVAHGGVVGFWPLGVAKPPPMAMGVVRLALRAKTYHFFFLLPPWQKWGWLATPTTPLLLFFFFFSILLFLINF